MILADVVSAGPGFVLLKKREGSPWQDGTYDARGFTITREMLATALAAITGGQMVEVSIGAHDGEGKPLQAMHLTRYPTQYEPPPPPSIDSDYGPV